MAYRESNIADTLDSLREKLDKANSENQKLKKVTKGLSFAAGKKVLAIGITAIICFAVVPALYRMQQRAKAERVQQEEAEAELMYTKVDLGQIFGGPGAAKIIYEIELDAPTVLQYEGITKAASTTLNIKSVSGGWYKERVILSERTFTNDSRKGILVPSGIKRIGLTKFPAGKIYITALTENVDGCNNPAGFRARITKADPDDITLGELGE